jgi:hypothetical protein
MSGADRLRVGLLVGHLPPMRVGDRDCRRRIARTSMGSRKICAAVAPAGRQRLDLRLFGANDERREIEGEGEADLRAGAVAAKSLLCASFSGGLVDAAIWLATCASVSDRRPKGGVGVFDCMSLP